MKHRIQFLRRRREFITLLGGAAAWPLTARAQQPARVPRIGFLGNSTAALEENLVQAFRDGLHDLGYLEGHNILIEYRWAEGNYEQFPTLIAELIALKVDLFVTAGTPAALAVKKAATSIPLVMGKVRVTCCSADTLTPPLAKMTSGASATNSAAYLRWRSISFSPQRVSIRILRPSLQPNCCRACWNATRRA
jgi:ABC transporter substrate binding protein